MDGKEFQPARIKAGEATFISDRLSNFTARYHWYQFGDQLVRFKYFI